ncbi:MAG: extradiol dioxygenase [Mesorhizobium sp.]|nr:MAG: extradiol dioxygenase [Mesorhizobium sp.]
MISGAHMIIYSTDAEADRAFFRNVLRFPAVDAGEGWLIFALPPAEIAVHPAAEVDSHEVYLMCEDINATIQELKSHDVECTSVTDEGWGLLTHVSLPSGGSLGLYQPRHPLAHKAGAA